MNDRQGIAVAIILGVVIPIAAALILLSIGRPNVGGESAHAKIQYRAAYPVERAGPGGAGKPASRYSVAHH